LVYFFNIPLIGALTYIFISDELGNEIRMGELSNYLLRPYSVAFEALTRAVASKLNNFITTIPIYLLVILYITSSLHYPSITLVSIGLFLIAIGMGFFLHFLFDLIIAYLAFWVVDVWSFVHFKKIVFLIFGGLMFPLDFLPAPLDKIFMLLPFHYVYYLPNAYLMGKRSFVNLGPDVGLFIIWMIIFFSLQRYVWSAGLKKYEASGG